MWYHKNRATTKNRSKPTMTYKEYKEITQKDVNEFITNYCFIAFGQKQFDEQSNIYFKKHNTSLEQLREQQQKLIHIGGGIYMLQKFYNEQWEQMSNEHHKLFVDNIESNKDELTKAFLIELNNHEFNFTNDPTDAIQSLGYSINDIEQNEYLNDCLISAMNHYRGNEYF